MDDWRFITHADGTWSWLNVETDHVSGSFQHFGSLDDAVADAAEHGFEHTLSRSIEIQHERRTKPRSGVRRPQA